VGESTPPEAEHHISVFCRLAHNVALDRALVGQHLHAVMARVMRQDVAVIEAIEATAGYEGSLGQRDPPHRRRRRVVIASHPGADARDGGRPNVG